MREIKFRAWTHKGFIYRELPHNGFMAHPMAGDPQPRIWQQYTGIKDKNGKEIYEGDIITHSNDGMVGVVCWGEGLYRFVIENLEQTEIIADLCDYDFEPEVIGNIMENKELLK